MSEALYLFLPENVDLVVARMIGAYVVSAAMGGFAAGAAVASVWRWATRWPR